MVSKDIWVLVAMVIYFAAMLTIGFVYSKRSNSSTRQYFAGGNDARPSCGHTRASLPIRVHGT